MALAAISEGYCPEHKTPLDPQPQGGWCASCGHQCASCEPQGAWWSVSDGDTVVTKYPALA